MTAMPPKTDSVPTPTGKIAASASQAYSMVEGLPPGHLEQEPYLWLQAVDNTVRTCIQQLQMANE